MQISIKNKIYPKVIQEQVETALSFFPELALIPIEFKFKKNIKRSTMQAQPKFSKILSPRHHREYLIFIKEKFTLGAKETPIENLPKDVITGWLGHELGHIKDYETRSNTNLVGFGLKYLFSHKAIVNAERTADRFAIEHGMKDYILKTKDFILNHAEISDKYKTRIKKFYLSPEELMEMIES